MSVVNGVVVFSRYSLILLNVNRYVVWRVLSARIGEFYQTE